jgi:hypothetical protein
LTSHDTAEEGVEGDHVPFPTVHDTWAAAGLPDAIRIGCGPNHADVARSSLVRTHAYTMVSGAHDCGEVHECHAPPLVNPTDPNELHHPEVTFG